MEGRAVPWERSCRALGASVTERRGNRVLWKRATPRRAEPGHQLTAGSRKKSVSGLVSSFSPALRQNAGRVLVWTH